MFHTLLVAVICCMALSLLSKQRFRDFPIYLGIFHLHMLMDLVGSGEGWGIPYFSPFYKYEYMWNRWDLYSWQNLTIFGILFFWTLAIAKYQKRTPLEAIGRNWIVTFSNFSEYCRPLKNEASLDFQLPIF